jgi:hypothetical protein
MTYTHTKKKFALTAKKLKTNDKLGKKYLQDPSLPVLTVLGVELSAC